MRDLFINFRKSEAGASLVEYAVALIVVTLVGGAGVLAIGTDAGGLTTSASGITSKACTDAAASSALATGTC